MGTATADNDFTITLTKVNDVWTPDCTFAEAQAAYNGGKNLVFQTDGTDNTIATGWHYDDLDGFYYDVEAPFTEDSLPGTWSYNYGSHYITYRWSNSNVRQFSFSTYYSTEFGNASAADVRTGKEFYNADGLQIGTMANGSATTPATTITANPSISVDSSGLITATASASKSITPTVSAGYVNTGTAGTVTVSGSNTSQLTTQAAKTVTPSTSSQTAVAAGRYTTGAVTVAAMPSGTAGTPTATKGTVSNHSVTVTPSVTNTTGYITGGTKTGTAVTVNVAELESGTKTITENGTGIGVSGYSAVDVNVPTGIKCPVFTVTSEGETIESTTLTCNMTFQECYDCINTDGSDDTEEMDAAVLYWPSSLTGDSDVYDGLSYRGVSASAITYIEIVDGLPYMEITYSRNTGITVSTPSSLDTLSVTANGTYTAPYGKVYTEVDVNVSPTYTATISGTTGSKTFSYVRHVASDQKYYTDGDTFTYQSGQTLYCRIGSQNIGGGELIIDGTMIDSAYPQGQDTARTIQYNYTLPECDIEIEFGRGASNVDRITITTHPPIETVELLTVTQNGTYTAPSGTAYSPVVVDVSGGGTVAEEKDVNFIDYDGTIFYSYTAAEFAQLSALPANPSHAGLTAQGWNWSLSDAKTYVAKYGKLNIGQMYITTSGATEIDITLTAPDLHPYLGIAPNGTVVIDWGDNSATDTVTGTSDTTLKFTGHEYATAGNYTINLTVSSGRFTFHAAGNDKAVLSETTAFNRSNRYSNDITSIRFGTNAYIGSYAFNSCYSLSSVTLPDSVTSIGSYAFNSCYSLSSIIIPDGVTSIVSSAFNNCCALTSLIIPDSVTNFGLSAISYCFTLTSLIIPDSVLTIGSSALSNCYSLSSVTIPDSVTNIGSSAFGNCRTLTSLTIPDGITSIDASALSNCYSLSSVTLPDSVTSIGSSALSNCYALKSLTIPSGVTSIGTNAFSGCYGMTEFHFLPTTPPTLGGTNAFNNVPTTCIFYVPAASLEAYQTATNWSTYASRMQEE